jgi:Bacterial PH domain
MSPFAFGRREGVQREKPLPSFTTDVTDEEDLEEIKKIRQMLNPNEEVFVVARQSRLRPGGSAFTPNVVFATGRRIIIKDPILLGMRENIVDIPYDMISSVRLDKGVFSSNIIFRAPGLTNSSPRGKLDKIMHRNGNTDWQGGGGNGMITAIPKNKLKNC